MTRQKNIEGRMTTIAYSEILRRSNIDKIANVMNIENIDYVRMRFKLSYQIMIPAQ